MNGANSPRRLRLRYRATCAACGLELSPRTEALWDPAVKKATCLACAGIGATPQEGEAGASAAGVAAALESRAVEQARKKWGDHAAAVAAKIAHDDPSISAWEKGGAGESRLASFIRREVGDAVFALHDRLIPAARRANIDHLFVAPSGVWIVDAKTYKGRIEKRDVGPLWRQQIEFFIGGRNRTKLADGLTLQTKAVRAALEDDPVAKGVLLHPALCFIDTEWPLLMRPFESRGVAVLHLAALRDRLKKRGPLSVEVMEQLVRRLALSLPAAHAS